jgi:glycerol-3-phosphate dehydrogenase
MVSLRRRGGIPAPIASDSLDAARRARELAGLADGETVDVLVVGGGIVGTWVALDAATRGLSAALVERGDLAQGTSRWSSKLAHGGLRYLAHGDVGVAWESARERAILMDVSAPHLIRALPFLIPLGGQVGRADGAKLETGLRLGDALRAAAGTSRRRLPPARRVSGEEARRLAPALSDRQLRGALLHWDGQIEDDARLVLAVARSAAAYGARILTYVEAGELRADGASVRDVLGRGLVEDAAAGGAATGGDASGDEAFDLRARHVVNATGVWAGELSGGAVRLQPSKGSHLLLPAAALGEPRAAVNAPLPGESARFVFAVPRPDGLVMVGITDAPFDGPIPDVPAVDAEEEAFLLTSIGRVLERAPTPQDVVGRYAGLRPLLAHDDAADSASTADLSRRHAVVEHDGILTVVGGKLTTARRMAQDAIDRVVARAAVAAAPCATHRVRLAGADRPADAGTAPIAPGVPASHAQLRFAVEHELALTVGDLLDRRTRLGLVPQRRAAALDAAHEALAGAARV